MRHRRAISLKESGNEGVRSGVESTGWQDRVNPCFRKRSIRRTGWV